MITGDTIIDYRYLNCETLEFVESFGVLQQQLSESGGGVLNVFSDLRHGQVLFTGSSTGVTEVEARLKCRKACEKIGEV